MWAEGEAQTTTLARLFPVRATQQDAAIAAIELLARVGESLRARRVGARGAPGGLGP